MAEPMSKKQRIGHARETTRADAAAAARPTQPAPVADEQPPEGTVVPLRGPERARNAREAVDRERRHRRETAMGDRPLQLPPQLGERLRRRSLLLVATEDEASPGASELPP